MSYLNKSIIFKENEVYKKTRDVIDQIKKTPNGTWGLGMFSGAMFPDSMNGPMGYVEHPLPNSLEFPIDGPQYYNAKNFNGPDYNQLAFKSISGTYGLDSVSVSGSGSNSRPNRDMNFNPNKMSGFNMRVPYSEIKYRTNSLTDDILDSLRQ